MAGLLLSGILALLFVGFHAPPVQRWILRDLIARLSALVPGTVSIGSLEYRLWLGEATLRDVRVEPDGDGAIARASVDEVRVRWVFPRRADIVAFRPFVELRSRKGETGRSKPVEPSLPAWIAELRLVEGQLEFRGEETRVHLRPIDTILTADLRSGGHRGTISVEGGSAALGSRSLDFRSIDVEARLAGGRIETRLHEIVTDAGEAEGIGHIDALTPFEARFDLDFRLDAARAEAVLLESVRQGIRGEVKGSVQLDFTGQRLVSAGRAGGTGLFFRDVGPLDGSSRFRLEDELLQLEATFHRGGARVDADAVLDLERSEQTFTLGLDASSMNALLRDARLEPAPWESSVRGRFSGRMERFSPDTVRGRGQLFFAGRDLEGRVDLDARPGRVSFAARDFAFPGGRALVQARVDGLEVVTAEYQLRIGDLETTLRPFLQDRTGWIGGELRVDGRASGPVRDLAAIRNSMNVQSEDVRLRGIPFLAHADLDQQASALDFHQLSLATFDAAVPGQVSLSGSVDLAERRLDVEGALESFPARAPAPVEGLEARITGSFEASGGFESPSGAARIDWIPIGGSETELPPLQVDLRSDGVVASADILRLDSGVSLGAARVSLSDRYPLEAEIHLGSLPWAELKSALVSGGPEVSSVVVEGEAHIRMPLAEPKALEGDVDVRSARVVMHEKTISASPFQLNLRGDAVVVNELALLIEDETLSVDGVLGLAAGTPTRLDVQGRVPLELAEAFVRGRKIGGLVELDLELSGSLRDPSLTGDIAVQEGQVSSSGARPYAVPVLENLRMEARAIGDRLEVESFEADVLGGTLDAQGSVPISEATDGEPARLAFDLAAIDVAQLAETVRGARSVVTAVSAGGEVRFPEGRPVPFEASGEIEEVLLASEGGIVSLAARAGWRYGASGASVDEILLEGDRTELRVAVTPGGDDGGGIRVGIDGKADLEIANSLLPESAYVAGAANVDVAITTGPGGLALSGTAEVSEGELTLENPAFAVTAVSADLELESGTVRVRRLTARAGGGTLAGEGALTIPGSTEDESGLRLDLEADQVSIEYPEGLKSTVTARLALVSRSDRYRLSGEIDVDRALFERAISPEREFLNAIDRQTLKLKGEPGLAGRVDLELAVSTKRDVVVDNNLGEMRWEAGLLVSGTLAAPEASGTLSAMPGGTLTFLGNEYELETAEIVLNSYPLDPPELDIQARTEVGGKEVVLSISGKSDNLRTTLESPTDPALSRGDVASLLLTGRTLDEVKGREADVLGREAATYLGSRLAQLTEASLSTALPLTVRLEPGIVGSVTDPGVRFSIGRPLTEDIFLTYSIGLDDPEKQLWIIDFNLPRRLKLRAIRDDQNEYTGGLSQDVLFDFYERNRPKRLDALPKSKILSIEIEGDASLASEKIDDALELEVGDGYDYWKARDDADRLVKKLRAEGRLSAEVEPSTLPPEAASGEPVELIYEIDRGPLVSILWTGDPAPEDLRAGVSERFEGYAPPRAQALRIGRELRWELMSRGHYAAAVETEVQEREDAVEVTYHVTLGPPGGSVEIQVEGNENLEDDEIERLFPDPSSPEFFELVVGKTETLREEVELMYAGEGFLQSKVLELSSRSDAETGNLLVLLRVAEGEPSSVGRIVFRGAPSFSEERLRSELELREGEPFQFLTHLGDQKRLASFYRGEGFPDVRVRSTLERNEDTVDEIFEIEEGALVRVGNIRIVGARATRERVIRGALTFERGDPLRLADLIDTQRRLNNLRVFRSVNVKPESTGTEGTRDVLIELIELPDLRLGYGGQYNTEDGLEVTGDVELTNVLGTGRQMGFHAFANRRMTELRATFDIPSFLGRDVGSSFFVARETEEGEGFVAGSLSATFQQARRVFSDVLAQWSFSHKQVSVTQTIPDDFFDTALEVDRSVLSFSLIEDTRSSLTRPRTGHFWNATLQFAPPFLGSDLRFLKLYGQFFLYRPLWGDAVWASTYRAGIADGFGQVLLPTDRFRAGGPNSVRGYPVNGLGPPDPLYGAVIGGEGVFVMNQELRIPLFWRLGGIAFYDAGNVFLERSDFNPFDLRHTTGLGLSVDLPVGLATVDWAVLLNPPPHLPRTRWVFTFGYSF
jgi:outer membrane protein assembly complex protein YaeT